MIKAVSRSRLGIIVFSQHSGRGILFAVVGFDSKLYIMMPALIASVHFLDGLTNTRVQLHWTLMIRFCLIERLKNVFTALALPPARLPGPTAFVG